MLTRKDDGSLVLDRGKEQINEAMRQWQASDDPKAPAALRKMSDRELDRFILQSRVELQAGKRLLVLFLVDLRVKNVFVLPGKVDSVGRRFKREGEQAVSEVLDGDELLKAYKRVLTADTAAVRKRLRAEDNVLPWPAWDLLGELLQGASARVAKPGGPQFDYEREVREARTAYPELRKRLGLSEKVKLPDGTEGKSAAPKK